MLGDLGNYYHNQYEDGNREVIKALAAEEANLLQARRLALDHARQAAPDDAGVSQWWDAVTGTMQGLRALYDHTSRRVEWARLVQEMVPGLVEPGQRRPPAGPGRAVEYSYPISGAPGQGRTALA